MSATILLARLLGLYMLAVSAAVLVRGPAMMAAVVALVDEPALCLMLGLIVLPAGLAIVLTHNRWSGGVLPVVITLLGWITVVRGLLLLFVPELAARIVAALGIEDLPYAAAVVPLALGVYLTHAGFAAKRSTAA